MIVITVLGLTFYPIKILAVNDFKKGTGLLIPIKRGTGFTLEYTHSVHKTKVQEHFVFAPNNNIVLTSTTFQSLGVGIPFLPEEGKLVNDNGVYLLTGMNREFESITLGFMPIAQQGIILNGKKYKLEDYFIEGSFIKISYKNISPIKIIWQSVQGGKEVLYE
ncbi:MAG: DUF1850 domain-containing protein [Syntrophomonadaceae bacterium]|nr:DUF1850 domain-containing protein [Syntrophomonadaceae bacterium]